MQHHEPDDTSLLERTDAGPPERTDRIPLVGHENDAIDTDLQRREHTALSNFPQAEHGVPTPEHEESSLPGGRQDDSLHADPQRRGPDAEPGGRHDQPVVADGERDQQAGPAGQEAEPVVADPEGGDPEGPSEGPRNDPLGAANRVIGSAMPSGSGTEHNLITPAQDEPIPSHLEEREPTSEGFRSTSNDPDDQTEKGQDVKADFPQAPETDMGVTDAGGADGPNTAPLSPEGVVTAKPGFAYTIPQHFYYLAQMFRNLMAFFARRVLGSLMFACDLLLSTLIFLFHSVLGLPGAGFIGATARLALFFCQLILWVLYTMVELIFFLPPYLLVPYIALLFLAYLYLPDAVTSSFEAIVRGAHKMLHLVKGVAANPV